MLWVHCLQSSRTPPEKCSCVGKENFLSKLKSWDTFVVKEAREGKEIWTPIPNKAISSAVFVFSKLPPGCPVSNEVSPLQVIVRVDPASGKINRAVANVIGAEGREWVREFMGFLTKAAAGAA